MNDELRNYDFTFHLVDAKEKTCWVQLVCSDAETAVSRGAHEAYRYLANRYANVRPEDIRLVVGISEPLNASSI